MGKNRKPQDESSHCACGQPFGWGHTFDDDMVCNGCGMHWTQHKYNPVRCQQPDHPPMQVAVPELKT